MITFVRVTSPAWPPVSAPPPSRWRREARKLGIGVVERVAYAVGFWGVLEAALPFILRAGGAR